MIKVWWIGWFKISIYERNAAGNLLQRKDQHADRNEEIAGNYDQEGKKNPKKKIMEKIAPFIVLGGIAIIYMIIINS